MKKTTRISALFLSMLLILSNFALCVIAEPDTTPTDTYTVNLVYDNAGAESVDVTINQLAIDQATFTGDATQALDIRVDPKAQFEITSVTFKVQGSSRDVPFTQNGSAFTYHLDFPTVNAVYEVHVNAKAIPADARVNIWAKDENLADVSYDAFVNGTKVESFDQGDGSDKIFDCKTGDNVTLTFNIPDFNAANSFLKVNGANTTLESNSYSFTVQNSFYDIDFGYNIVPVNFVVNNGPAVIKYHREGAPEQTLPDGRKSVYFKKGIAYNLTVEAGVGRVYQSTTFAGCEPTGENGVYVITANNEITVTVNLEIDTQLPTGVTVNVNCGANSNVTVNDSDDRTIQIENGEDVVITAIPNNGYIVDNFTINGRVAEFIDNAYIIENVSENLNIRVTFIKDDVGEAKLVGVDDINWESEKIIVNLRGGKKVAPEVLEKISDSETDGRIVEFQSELGSVCVPLGKQFVGDIDNVDLRIKQVTDTKTLKLIRDTIAEKTGAEIEYKAFALDFGTELPKGSYLIFNLGMGFAEYKIDVLEFDSANKKFTSKGEIEVDEKGLSANQEYNGEKIILCSKKVAPTYIIESSTKNDGGTINPLGKQNVKLDASCSYSISANTGYVIKQLIVDGTPVAEAAGKTSHIYHFDKVGENHTIEVEFEPKALDVEEEKGTSTLGTVIVVIVIVLVALAGAGALFYVKWNQEKF